MRRSGAALGFCGTLIVGFLFFFGTSAESPAMDPLRVDLGTLALKDSSFYMALAEMGENWRKASGGAINLVIHPGGVQGSEATMVRMMRGRSLGAGMFTVVGLSEINRAVGGLSFLPLTFNSWEEYDYVVEKLSPKLEALLLEKGFVVLFWGDAGWVRFFSKSPAMHPDDFKRFKMFTWAGNSDQVDMMKALGYNPVPAETATIVTDLQTDRINAIPLPANQALLLQCYSYAKNMLDLKWSVLSGATIIRKDVWDKIPADIQVKLRSAAAAAGAKIRASARKEDELSIAAMQKRGLVVQQTTPQVVDEWHSLTKVIYPQLRGKSVPADIFDEVQRLVAEYRAGGTKK